MSFVAKLSLMTWLSSSGSSRSRTRKGRDVVWLRLVRLRSRGPAEILNATVTASEKLSIRPMRRPGWGNTRSRQAIVAVTSCRTTFVLPRSHTPEGEWNRAAFPLRIYKHYCMAFSLYKILQNAYIQSPQMAMSSASAPSSTLSSP